MSLLTLRGLFERLRAPSQSQKGHFSEKTKLKKWHQNSWHWQKSAQSLEIFVTSHGICRGVGMSSRKGEHFPFWKKNGAHQKIKPGTTNFVNPHLTIWNLLVGCQQITNFLPRASSIFIILISRCSRQIVGTKANWIARILLLFMPTPQQPDTLLH